MDQAGANVPAPDTETSTGHQVAQLQQRLEERNAAVAEMRADIDRLSQGYQARIRDLERKLGDRTEQSISAMIDAKKPPTFKRFASPEKISVDDMTEISGVGPVLQQTLNGLGIHS